MTLLEDLDRAARMSIDSMLASRLRKHAARIRKEMMRPPPRASAKQFEHDMWRGGIAVLESINQGGEPPG